MYLENERRTEREQRVGKTHFLLNLQAIDHRRKFSKNLVCFLVKFKLRGDQVGKVP